MSVTAPVPLRNLVAGDSLAGTGDPVYSTNPANPRLTVTEGGAAQPRDLQAAVAAAADAQARWAATPIHERNAADWGVALAAEEGKTKAEGIGEVRRAAQILRYYGNEGDRQAGEMYASPRPGEQILVTRKPLGVVGVITSFNFPIAIPAWKIEGATLFAGGKPYTAAPLADDPHVPFGGARNSGLGPKEQGTAAREFFTHTTTVCLRGGAARL
jgi:alpha-ketoglutaric semialdehyde dehydrogenase